MQNALGPSAESERIESLDVLRGFALLGILAVNVLMFGLLSGAYFNPGQDLTGEFSASLIAWASVELWAEGAMRCLFSILFGAGVVLFTAPGREDVFKLHYKRNFWLLIFGLLNAYVLVWKGDILVPYAIAGALLYWVRNWSPQALTAAALLIMIALTGYMGVGKSFVAEGRIAAAEVAARGETDELPQETLDAAEVWKNFSQDTRRSESDIAAELQQRNSSYASAVSWNAKKTYETHTGNLWSFLLWDALAMMLLGMALYKWSVLQARLSSTHYKRMALAGILVGLAINGYEVLQSYKSGFDFLAVFSPFWPTYQFGRLALAIGYIGLFCYLLKQGYFKRSLAILASVGRMALTNYLLQSLICLFVFTGAGLGLAGELNRAQLYLVVFGIWIFQLWFSRWWMQRYLFGPMEWVWRGLTYGKLSALVRQ